jgi:hypothetical protein
VTWLDISKYSVWGSSQGGFVDCIVTASFAFEGQDARVPQRIMAFHSDKPAVLAARWARNLRQLERRNDHQAAKSLSVPSGTGFSS